MLRFAPQLQIYLFQNAVKHVLEIPIQDPRTEYTVYSETPDYIQYAGQYENQ